MNDSIRILRKDEFFHPDGFPITVIRRNPQEPIGLHSHDFWEVVITLDQLVEISNMSRRNFMRAFEAAMGDSPVQYLIGLRIRKARERLRLRNTQITEVAMDVGFSDSNYFSRKLREVVGVSPRDYKRLYRENSTTPKIEIEIESARLS